MNYRTFILKRLFVSYFRSSNILWNCLLFAEQWRRIKRSISVEVMNWHFLISNNNLFQHRCHSNGTSWVFHWPFWEISNWLIPIRLISLTFSFLWSFWKSRQCFIKFNKFGCEFFTAAFRLNDEIIKLAPKSLSHAKNQVPHFRFVSLFLQRC